MVQSTTPLDVLLDEPNAETSHGGCSNCGKGNPDGSASKCGNGLEKIYPTTAIRYGYMRYVGEFRHSPDMKFTCGARVVIQTKRGNEIGEQVSLTCGGCDKSVTRDQMKQWVDSCGSESFYFGAGRILREATAADLAENAHIRAGDQVKRRFAQEVAKRLKLDIKLVESEYLFGGERIIFFFTAPDRVDYRAMVKELAKEYRTRIEMRQIGARDEARLLADFETCGREVCCKVFLKTLRPISMRMAKLQKATLDPSQVSGRCGRLKCCLRYEHTSYEELDKLLPRMGAKITSSDGDGVVINRQILTQLLQIRTDSDELVTVMVENIGKPKPKKPDPPAPAPVASSSGREKTRPRSRQGRKSEKRPAESGQSERARNVESGEAGRDGKNAVADANPTDGNTKPSPKKRRRRRRGRGRGGPRGDGAGGAPEKGSPS